MRHFKLVISLLATSLMTTHALAQSVPMPDTWDRILGFLDWFSDDLTEDEIRQNALNYAFIWGGFPSAAIDYFRSANPNINIARYRPAFEDDYNARPEPFDPFGGGDTPDRRARTLLWWNTEAEGVGHPDWVMYRCNGITPAYHLGVTDDVSGPNMPLDITNPEVIDWQVRTIGIEEAAYTALARDMASIWNLNYACGVYRDGQWSQLFTGEYSDPMFLSAVVDWTAQLRGRLQELSSPLALVASLPLYYFFPDEDIASFAANLDGILDEAGFTGYGVDRLLGEAWLHKVRNMIALQNQGTAVYSVNYVSTFPPTHEEIDWILGSFLMAKEHAAYALITSGDVTWPHLPQYDEDLGHPCGSTSSFQNVYRRDYSKGMSVVNPSATSSYTITLGPDSFSDLYGNPVGDTLTLGARRGKVLLSESDRCL